MTRLVILSSPNTKILEKESEDYEIHQIGSLSVSNGQYFLTFLGSLKVKPETKVTPEEPEVKPKPKETTKPSVSKIK
jgi:hypothetical protein